MENARLGAVEARFADIVWKNEPLTTRELVNLCEKELNWKRTTTYTVLKKLCERGIFLTENSKVTALVSREEFYAIQSEKFVEDTFDGSLPAFLAAFTARKALTDEEVNELRRMVKEYEEGRK
ncbi:MAG: BlaI/MecI/CopY family transcriptional regulator [Oscillospiraceae bacterium]|nr:BlaI/MecI/CopY family transcriptional regulator [Oscillospiraceae bacterium]